MSSKKMSASDKQPRPFNHHGTPSEILGANGEKIQVVPDEKTVINSFLPNKDLVLVRQRNETKVIVSDNASTSGCPFADVIATGPSCKLVKEGDRVSMAGGCTVWPIPYRGLSGYFLMREGDIFGIVNPQEGDRARSAKLFDEYVIVVKGDSASVDELGDLDKKEPLTSTKEYLNKTGVLPPLDQEACNEAAIMDNIERNG